MYMKFLAILFLFAILEEIAAERRYCGTALIERVIEVCSQMDCGTVDEIREL
uniref:Uncharacterized protein n=1 Tax=Acrobeloides nanus TaxID=290746 RepID=A0A914EKP5_9BILA